ncbi:MmcQ/YjbR family DNA-binding protein [Caulobacter sp. NIBR2454]|uniref:MmcQ/YjbR family DNA-binding protein n=1 Tax=Caulobacter sp. NIBR2454 TaxID=3015996 RepID=UPI0022B66DD2|nr:MmcQ/YjbR family DNA-binding protein [Caulobacter sp. NIBR2454]
MTRDEFHALVMSLPGVEPGTSWGMASYKLKGKFFTRLREEDDSIVVQEVDFDERDMLIEAEPDIFHFTDHFRNYRMVLVRIGPVEPAVLLGLLERRWRKVAPKAVVSAYDAANGKA